MLGTSALLVLLAGWGGILAERVKPSEVVIHALEQRFNTGLLEKNEEVIGALLADDLVHIGFEGQFAGKAEYMSFFKGGAWRYLKYEPSNVAVKVFGDAAVVTGRVDRIIMINDRETRGAFAFTHVWSRKNDQWLLSSSHVTTVPSAAAPTQ